MPDTPSHLHLQTSFIHFVSVAENLVDYSFLYRLQYLSVMYGSLPPLGAPLLGPIGSISQGLRSTGHGRQSSNEASLREVLQSTDEYIEAFRAS